MAGLIFSPAGFIAVLNQTLEFAYPSVTIEGELANFRISKNRWVYFDLKDDEASVSFFGTVYMLPGPLQDGLNVRVTGLPRHHPRFGFAINMSAIAAVGEGSIKKAADLLRQKLEAEGLFSTERKRLLPTLPGVVGLITAEKSAAHSDFIKIVAERWGGLEILTADVYVQGDKAPEAIIRAIEHFNQMTKPPEIIVITRGGGSAEDLAAFSDERVVRAVATSRIPTLVGIGHENDISLAELAADVRASTPSNAAQILVPDRRVELLSLKTLRTNLSKLAGSIAVDEIQKLATASDYLQSRLTVLAAAEREKLTNLRRILELFNPDNALKRGYALIFKDAIHIRSITQLKQADGLILRMADGTIHADVTKIIKGDT